MRKLSKLQDEVLRLEAEVSLLGRWIHNLGIWPNWKAPSEAQLRLREDACAVFDRIHPRMIRAQRRLGNLMRSVEKRVVLRRVTSWKAYKPFQYAH